MPKTRRTEAAALAWFGDLVDRHQALAIDVGGAVVPGADASEPSSPGKEEDAHEPTESAGPAGTTAGARAGDGPAAGPRSGRRAPAQAPARSAAHALRQLTEELRSRFGDWTGNGITEGELEELATFYPDVRVTASSSRFAYLGLSATPFLELGVGFRFVFELPHPRYVTEFAVPAPRLRVVDFVDRELVRSGRARPSLVQSALLRPRERLVPSVRAWARWEGGPAHGALVISHHRQPDFSICACRSHDWKRGRDLLVDFVGMAVCWAAKVQYEQATRRYPGVQHYPEWSRRERARAEEFCGCGEKRLYGECHRRADLVISAAELQRMERESRRAYFEELARERRPVVPPADAWR